jgi:hypothetical protein
VELLGTKPRALSQFGMNVTGPLEIREGPNQKAHEGSSPGERETERWR